MCICVCWLRPVDVKCGLLCRPTNENWNRHRGTRCVVAISSSYGFNSTQKSTEHEKCAENTRINNNFVRNKSRILWIRSVFRNAFESDFFFFRSVCDYRLSHCNTNLYRIRMAINIVQNKHSPKIERRRACTETMTFSKNSINNSTKTSQNDATYYSYLVFAPRCVCTN